MLPLHAIAHVTFSTTPSLLVVFSPRHRRSSSGSMFSSHAHPDTSLEELFEAYTRRKLWVFFLRFQGENSRNSSIAGPIRYSRFQNSIEVFGNGNGSCRYVLGGLLKKSLFFLINTNTAISCFHGC